MKFGVAVAATVVLLGTASQVQARGGFAHPAVVGGTTIPAGSTVGPQTIPGGPLTNNGTINGGNHTAVTSTGPDPVDITNNGAINSSTGGIKTSGSPSSTIVNNGSINVQNTATSTGPNASANATLGTGISQTTGP